MEELGIKINDWQNTLHMSFASYHIGKYCGVIECPHLPLNGKTLIKEYKQNYLSGSPVGKGKRTFYIDEPNSPMFTSINALVNHYHGIQPTTNETTN